MVDEWGGKCALIYVGNIPNSSICFYRHIREFRIPQKLPDSIYLDVRLKSYKSLLPWHICRFAMKNHEFLMLFAWQFWFTSHVKAKVSPAQRRSLAATGIGMASRNGQNGPMKTSTTMRHEAERTELKRRVVFLFSGSCWCYGSIWIMSCNLMQYLNYYVSCIYVDYHQQNHVNLGGLKSFVLIIQSSQRVSRGHRQCFPIRHGAVIGGPRWTRTTWPLRIPCWCGRLCHPLSIRRSMCTFFRGTKIKSSRLIFVDVNFTGQNDVLVHGPSREGFWS